MHAQAVHVTYMCFIYTLKPMGTMTRDGLLGLAGVQAQQGGSHHIVLNLTLNYSGLLCFVCAFNVNPLDPVMLVHFPVLLYSHDLFPAWAVV